MGLWIKGGALHAVHWAAGPHVVLPLREGRKQDTVSKRNITRQPSTSHKAGHLAGITRSEADFLSSRITPACAVETGPAGRRMHARGSPQTFAHAARPAAGQRFSLTAMSSKLISRRMKSSLQLCPCWTCYWGLCSGCSAACSLQQASKHLNSDGIVPRKQDHRHQDRSDSPHVRAEV